MPWLLASTVVPPDFETLVAEADTVFTGEVTDVSARWVGGYPQRHIESFVTFRVLRVMKGSPGSTYLLNQLGGTIGDRTQRIAGAPLWVKGDRAILFVKNNGTQIVPLVGLMHGYYPLIKDEDTREELVTKHDGTPLRATSEIDQIHETQAASSAVLKEAKTKKSGAAATPKGMTRKDFEDAIERKARELP